MPYYKIILEISGQTITGIREHPFETDSAFLTFQSAALEVYGNELLFFDCYHLSTHSEELKLYLKQKGKAGENTVQLRNNGDPGSPLDGMSGKTQASLKPASDYWKQLGGTTESLDSVD